MADVDSSVEFENVTPYQSIVLTGYDKWMRKFMSLLAICNIVLTLLLLSRIGTLDAQIAANHVSTGIPIKTMICAIGQDDAARDPVVAQIMRDNGCQVP